jgi:peptidyl-prolyl cis-trans isomerase D
MLSSLRKLLDNWIARAFFVLLVVVFVFWGVSNVLTMRSASNSVATVGGKPVDAGVVQTAYQAQLRQAQQSTPSPDLATRQQIAGAALGGVLRQRNLALEAERLGVAVPDAAVRQLVYGLPAFQSNGAFSQAVFNQVLQQNNFTPDQFLAEVKADLISRQLVLPVTEGAGPPTELVNQVFAFIAEQRFAETVKVTAAGQPAPAAPAPAVLQRYWRNHPAAFTAPELRTVKLVLLSPALLAPNETVSDDEINAAYARATAGQPSQALRSAQVIVSADPAVAARLAGMWRNDANWPRMQALAKAAGANAVELDEARQVEFPSPALGQAVFAAMPGEITGPVQGPLGVFVFKVTDTGSTALPPANLLSQIRAQLQLQKAQTDVAQDVNNLQDALAGQAPLDKLPGNIGLVALQGTMDANGNTAAGTPAPIPGGPDLKAAVVKAAFAATPHAPAQLITGPNGSYFALTIDAITPPAVQAFDQVQDKVLAAWTNDQLLRAAEQKAAMLLNAVNSGQTLDAAAAAAGDAVTMTPPVTRNAPANGVPAQLAQILFTLKPGQATMLQTPDGFTVAQLLRVAQPGPADDQADYAEVQNAMAKAMQNDIAQSFVMALRNRDKITVDQKLFAQIYQ